MHEEFSGEQRTRVEIERQQCDGEVAWLRNEVQRLHGAAEKKDEAYKEMIAQKDEALLKKDETLKEMNQQKDEVLREMTVQKDKTFEQMRQEKDAQIERMRQEHRDDVNRWLQLGAQQQPRWSQQHLTPSPPPAMPSTATAILPLHQARRAQAHTSQPLQPPAVSTAMPEQLVVALQGSENDAEAALTSILEAGLVDGWRRLVHQEVGAGDVRASSTEQLDQVHHRRLPSVRLVHKHDELLEIRIIHHCQAQIRLERRHQCMSMLS